MSGDQPTADGSERMTTLAFGGNADASETAQADAGGDSGGGATECPECGRTFGNAGAAARHAKACEGESASAAEPEPETENSDASDPEALEWTDMEPGEVGHVCERMSASEARATLANLGRESPDGERVQHTASKALANAHEGMDAAAYTQAFGECENPECEYGKNGIDAEYCARHEGADTHEGESADEPEPESEPEPVEIPEDAAEMSRDRLVGALVYEGVDAERAKAAAEAVLGGE
jgi:hypothetical protein